MEIPALFLSFLLILGSLARPSVVMAGQAGSPAPGNTVSGGRESVVVFPFLNISAQPADEWIGAGIAETVVADLNNAGKMAVVGPEAVREALSTRGSGLDVLDGPIAIELGRELRAAWLLTGGYQHLGDRVRITARIVDVRTGDVVRTAKVDGRLDEIFTLQDRIVTALDVGPSGSAPDPTPRPPGAPANSALTTAPGAGAEQPAPENGARRTVAAARLADGESIIPVETGAGPVTLIDAPRPPGPPATIARDSRNRATIRAVRVTTPLKIDGRLDEEVYRAVQPAGGFIQQLPNSGEPVAEPTDFWILFDDEHVYVSMMLHETDPGRRVSSERRRDAGGLSNDDNMMIVLDTFYDRRNGFNFNVNAVGGMRDQHITDGAANSAWNTVWEVRVADASSGWSFEMAIPFKSLRYKSAGSQVWGFNARRTTKWRNEVSFVNPNPAAYGNQGVHQLSTAATLVGIETPPRALNLEVKPYAITSLTTDRTVAVPFDRDGSANTGVDFKYGLTRSLTADVTVNTDFAQVEEDIQQVNLTRFSLFFPEKRDFFLEGQGNFGFGGQGEGNRGGMTDDVPTIFFSRQIGLSRGQTVPVRAGARVTGRLAGYEVGLLNIQTGDKPEASALATNFTAARLRRNILRRSNIGAIATLRRPSLSGGQNVAFGVDANLRFHEFLENNVYVARTATEGRAGGDDLSHRVRVAYNPDAWGFAVTHVKVGRTFNPEVGFVRRKDFRLSSANLRYSPRLKASRTIRQLTWQGNLSHITNSAASRLENRDLEGDFRIEFHNSDTMSATYLAEYELLPSNFTIAPGVVVQAGGYDHRTVRGSYSLGTQRLVSGTVNVQRGSFYRGTRTGAGFSGRLSFSPRFVVEPGLTLNRLALPYGRFSGNLLNTRFVVTPTPRMQMSGLVQYNPSARTLTSSARLGWEYTPGSELFVVYSDGRDTSGTGAASVVNQTFAVKATRLVRF